MTRCKQGDLARVINSVNGNDGKIVRCVEFRFGVPTMRFDGSAIYGLDGWLIDPSLPGRFGPAYVVADADLIPIANPGPDAVDEMVKLLGVPGEVTQGVEA